MGAMQKQAEAAKANQSKDYTTVPVTPPAYPGGYTPAGSGAVMRMRPDAPGIEPTPATVRIPKPATTAATTLATEGDGIPSKVGGDLRMDAGDIRTIKKRQNAASAASGTATLLGS